MYLIVLSFVSFSLMEKKLEIEIMKSIYNFIIILKLKKKKKLSNLFNIITTTNFVPDLRVPEGPG